MGRAGVRYESVSVRLFLKAVTSTNQNQRPAATHITQGFELWLLQINYKKKKKFIFALEILKCGAVIALLEFGTLV